MGTFWAALCLVLVIEGLLLFAAPAGWKHMVEHALTLPDATLRRWGGIMVVAGLLALQLLR